MHARVRATALLVAALLTLTGCSSSGSSSGTLDEGVSGPPCRHFRNVARDASDGVLTDAELRDKLQEIEQSARGATAPVRSAARDMLAAITSGTNDEFTDAVRAMGDACRADGY